LAHALDKQDSCYGCGAVAKDAYWMDMIAGPPLHARSRGSPVSGGTRAERSSDGVATKPTAVLPEPATLNPRAVRPDGVA
ncbi:MAG: hypothetical protein NTU41_07890, partial [Chloroflexi bacterium]|nr:hypothetical protein [Chloroflexota bacterium]